LGQKAPQVDRIAAYGVSTTTMRFIPRNGKGIDVGAALEPLIVSSLIVVERRE
jgi:hypothetical protein